MAELAVGVSDAPETDTGTPKHRADVEPGESNLETYGGPRWLTAPRRRWIYGIVAAVLPLLVLLGVMTQEVSLAVAGVALAVLSNGLALSNTTGEPMK